MKGMCIPRVDPTFVEELHRNRYTRLDLSNEDERLRDIWSFEIAEVP